MTADFHLDEPWWRRFPVIPIGIGLVLLVGVGTALVRGCGGKHGGQVFKDDRVKQVGTLTEPALTECSGIAGSRKHAGVYWVHNDGARERLWAVNRTGATQVEYKIDVKGTDWEDIAIDAEGNLYIADVGNNAAGDKDGKPDDLRRHVQVFQVKEPDPADKKVKKLDVERTWKLKYPDEPFDCEALVIHGGHGYLISKLSRGRSAVLYRFDLGEKEQTVERLGKLDLSEPVTSASISPDGNRLAVLTQSAVNIYRIDGDVTKAMKVRPTPVTLMGRKFEGVSFADDGVIVTAESREVMFVPRALYEK